MAFVQVDKRSYNSSDNPHVTMGAYLADGQAHKSKSVAFRVSYALLQQLGWPLSGNRYKVGVFEGTGEDAGFIQLVPHPDGYVAAYKEQNNSKQGVSVNVTIERFKHYILNECPVSSASVSHIVEGNTLIVECPDWLRFNPQSVAEPEPEPKKNVAQFVPNRQERRAIASKIARNIGKK